MDGELEYSNMQRIEPLVLLETEKKNSEKKKIFQNKISDTF
jgi:hypothetical protein